MCLSKIVFGDCGGNRSEQSRSDIAEDYLSTLLHNGQIYGKYLFAPCEEKLVAFANIARPGSLAKRYHSQWGLAALQKVAETFGRVPQCDIIRDNVPKRFPSWEKSSFFYLFTHAFDETSPVCCGDSGSPIPLYLLPISDQTRHDLCFWADHYRDHDNIWFGSLALEVSAYKQTADPRSRLSVMGRELCREVEAATDKRTFYYLQRYWGRKIGEQDRLCPMCGHRWRTAKKELEKDPFWKFPFRCVRCRLVSHCAVSYEDERHAAIGEYSQRVGRTSKQHLS
jgi:predicted  nucleic acid-binding Zn ribbon protein